MSSSLTHVTIPPPLASILRSEHHFLLQNRLPKFQAQYCLLEGKRMQRALAWEQLASTDHPIVATKATVQPGQKASLPILPFALPGEGFSTAPFSSPTTPRGRWVLVECETGEKTLKKTPPWR